MRRSGWTAGVVLGALLVTGCGSGGDSAAPASAQAKPSKGSAAPAGTAGQGGPAASAGTAGQGGSAAPTGSGVPTGPGVPTAPAASAAASGAPGVPGVFGKEQAAADIAAATAAGGLPQPGAAATASPAPTGADAEADVRRAEMAECMAPWQTMERVADPEKAYTATIAELERRGWKAAGDRSRHDMLSQVTLKKQGWILFARRYDFSAGKGSGMGMPDMLSFFASDLACEGRFTEAEMAEALQEAPEE
ncbi:hypothetical protein [Streptomyces sp. AP-93]|uniref:hypothetical protein n=1 Tax=Streptomyces sp. AP-93 TaxID=2929048 RepID=UPI001FAF9CCA|nr:hypothetical protein [Streptomyces sp. AP-93]MCJ0867887.1 hypothetical protein [Streptomyces sp. AP-93]